MLTPDFHVYCRTLFPEVPPRSPLVISQDCPRSASEESYPLLDYLDH